MKKITLSFLLCFITVLSFSQADGLTEMALKRMAKENTQRNKDSAYFANYEFDSTKLTNAILIELNKVRRSNNSKLVTCSKDTVQCNYVMKWSNHLAEVNKIGHGGARLYKAEVSYGGSLLKSQAGVDSQYAIVAHDAIQAFIDSPEHKRIILDPTYVKIVIGFACYPGKYSSLLTVVVIGFS